MKVYQYPKSIKGKKKKVAIPTMIIFTLKFPCQTFTNHSHALKNVNLILTLTLGDQLQLQLFSC